MKKSQPKVLRLNLVGSPKKEPEDGCQLPHGLDQKSEKQLQKNESVDSIQGPHVTPTSSPEVFTATEAGSSSVSSSDPGTSPFFIPETSKDLREKLLAEKYNYSLDESSSDSDNENMSTSSSMRFQPWMADIGSSQRHSSPHEEESSQRSKYRIQTSNMKALHEKFSKLDCETGHGVGNHRPDMEFSENIREAISLSRNAPLGPPPLCSIC